MPTKPLRTSQTVLAEESDTRYLFVESTVLFVAAVIQTASRLCLIEINEWLRGLSSS